MKKLLLLLLLLIISAVYIIKQKEASKIQPINYKNQFSTTEKKVLQAARTIIDSAYYGSFVTLDKNNQPKIRVMEPFKPDKHFVIYLATNPRSRKVQEIKNNSTSSLHYFDKKRVGYVSLYGQSEIVHNDSIKKALWKAGWERFYKNQGDDYMLIRFTPNYLEVISIPEGLTGDEKTWLPSQVKLTE